MKQYNLISLLAIVSLLCVVMLYAYYPLYSGHDYYFHINRIITLIEALKDGSFPTYMDYSVYHGYGYITKLFYSDFLLIPIARIARIFNLEFAYQTLIVSNTFMSAIFAYYAFKRITKDKFAAYVGAILYAFSAYKLYDIYIRSAVGEYIALTILPLALLGAYEIIEGNYKKWYILTIAMSLLIYTHLISSVLTCLFVFLFLIIDCKKLYKEPKRLVYLTLSALVCLPITAYYIFPMLEQMVSNEFLYNINSNNGISTYDIKSFIFAQVSTYVSQYRGLYATVGLLLIVILFFRFFVKEKSKELKICDIFAIIGIILIVACTDFFPWKIFPFKYLVFIQFSWRLNMMITLFFSLSGAYYLSKVIRDRKKQLISVVVIVIIASCTMVINSKYYYYACNNKREFYYPKNDDIFNIDYQTINPIAIVIGGEYFPSKMLRLIDPFTEEEGIEIDKRKDKVAATSTNISNFYKNKGHITFDAEVANSDNLELPLTYYKGYKTTLDGDEVDYQQSELGLIEIPVNKSGKVEIKYVGTTLQKMSWYVTLISIILFIIFVVADRRKMKQIKKENI